MEVIILAGGLGTRLRSVVSNVPKPMALINNKPFLDYIFNWLHKYPISKIVISAGYKADCIEKYYGPAFKDIPIHYVIEDEPLGTGGGILKALDHTFDENVMVVNGDTYFPIDIDIFYSEHIRLQGNITIALKEMTDFDRYGSVHIDNELNISQFLEKTFIKQGLINGGIYFINRKFIQENNLPTKFSFEKEVLEKEAINKKIKGIQFRDQFIDIGIPDDYLKANQLL